MKAIDNDYRNLRIHKSVLIAFFVLIFSYLLLQDFWQSAGIAYAIFVFSSYLKNLKHDIPIRETILLLATFQWVIGPIVEYNTSFEHFKYYMYTTSDAYFSYVVPGIIFLNLGLFSYKTRFKTQEFLDYVKGINTKYPRFALSLVFFGVISELIASKVPDSLRFVLYLAAQLKYVGVGFLLFSTQNYRKPLILIVLLSLVYSSLSSGFFHELIIWGILLFPFLNFKYNFSNNRIVGSAIIGIVLIFIIQSVKPVLRMTLKENGRQSPIEVFSNTLALQYSSGKLFDLNNSAQSNVRFNQGWIISAIMANVPEKTEYAYGQTIVAGTYSAIVPRILDPSKKSAGGREDFMRFTGLPLGDGTSMGISIIGEGYANFGYFGILFMFFYGLLISYFWKIFTNPNFRWGNLALFLPIIFLQVIKAESDFVTVFTHLIKASVFVYLFLIGIKLLFKIRL